MAALRHLTIEDMKLNNVSTKTVNAYVSRVSVFARLFRLLSPEHLGRDDVRSYQVFQPKGRRHTGYCRLRVAKIIDVKSAIPEQLR